MSDVARGAEVAEQTVYMAVEACVAAAHGSALPARVDGPIALVTKANVGRAVAAFSSPFRPYSDPFKRILRRMA